MSGVFVSIAGRAKTVLREFVRNGKAPVAELQNRLSELVGHACIAHTRQLFVRGMPITDIIDSNGTGARTRWRFAARSHPYPLYWYVQFENACQNNIGAVSDPYCVLDICTAASPTTVVATANYHFGSSDGSFTDTPNNFGSGLRMLLDTSGDPWTPDPSTNYVGRFYDVNYGRLFAASVHEVSLSADTDNGFASVSTTLGTPVYDADRQTPLVMARSIFKDASAPLWHWGSDDDSSAPSIAGASWTVDATSGKGTPLTEAEAEAVLSTAGVASPNVTNLWKFGTPASGNISDVIGAKTLTASGTWSYQQSVTGWAIKGLLSTAGTAARVLNNTFGNVNANSYVVFLLFAHLPAATGTRTLFRFGDTFDDDATVEMTSAGTDVLNVGEGDGTRSAGSTDFTGAARWAVLRIDDGANTVDLFTSQDKILGGTQACNGTELCFGGDNNQTWYPGDTHYMLAFVHTGTMTNTEIKSAITTLGFSPSWTP